jgi:glycosidase
MQWNAQENAGFTTGKPWLHVHKNYLVRNVANQSESQASLLNFYKQLIQLRRKHTALNAGDINLLDVADKDLLVYERSADAERVLVVLNFSRDIKTYQLPTGEFNQWELLYAGNDAVTSHMAENDLHLPAYGFGILISRSE